MNIVRVVSIAVSLLLLAACGREGTSSPPREAVFQVRVCDGSLQAPQGEVFRILLQDQPLIQEATALLATGGTHMVSGFVRAGDGGFNAPWSWHMDPASIAFPDVAAEICGSCPSFVENHLSSWLSVQFCPIGEVIARER